MNTPQPLLGKIALVAGASRGAGRGIAVELGAAGATVYVSARSVRGDTVNNRPETIEETAELVQAHGGVGIPVRVDHTDTAQVSALFDKIRQEHGHLDILVNSVWDQDLFFFGNSFWEHPLEQGLSCLVTGIHAPLIASRFAAPLMFGRPNSLIVTVSDAECGCVYYRLPKAAARAMTEIMAEELKPKGVAAVALVPSYMRTEIVLTDKGLTEENWQTVLPAETVTPRFVGRGVVALASDPKLLEKTGQVVHICDLAKEYGFTDLDSRQPEPFGDWQN